jgi:hypothetical protein
MCHWRVVAKHHAGVPKAGQVREDARAARQAGQRDLRQHARLRLLCVLHILLFVSCKYQSRNHSNSKFLFSLGMVCLYHRLSINRPTKRGKEKSPSDRHCQSEKEMGDHLLACQQIFEKEPHSDTPC